MEHNLKPTIDKVKRLGQLYIESGRLSVAEKSSKLLSAIAIFLIIFILAMALMIFVSLFVGTLLMETLPPHVCYLIIGGFYLLLIILVFLLRKPMIINPVTRFISSLIVTPPTTESNEK